MLCTWHFLLLYVVALPKFCHATYVCSLELHCVGELVMTALCMVSPHVRPCVPSRLTIGLVMLGLKGFGLAAAVLYNCFTSIAAAREFIRRYLWPYLPFMGKRPEDKFADLVGRVIVQVVAPTIFVCIICCHGVTKLLENCGLCTD